MATLWLTYAWGDNENGDVDFAAQELQGAGLDVKIDRWNLQAGAPLWEQIEEFIQDPARSDAWALYATQNSLGSGACKEEFRYALDRALHTRDENFPVIGLFPSPVDNSLIPAGIRTRLYVSLTDPDWKERITAAAERRDASIGRPTVDPYECRVHNLQRGFAIEVRPRAGTWAPFAIAILAQEKDAVRPSLGYGPRGNPNAVSGMLFGTGEEPSVNGEGWILYAQSECTPTQSYYLFCTELPSLVLFGVRNSEPMYSVNISR
jgi:hypothetical protein